MQMIGRLIFYFIIIRELTDGMKQCVRNNFNLVLDSAAEMRSVIHSISMLVERADNDADNSHMKITVDIAPDFPEHRIQSAIHHMDSLRTWSLLGLLTVLVAKETVDRKSLAVGQDVRAHIVVLETLQITADIRRTANERYHIVGLSWRHNWLGLVKRAAHE